MLQDLRFGIRLLLKDRWQTIASVFALAVGIGMNAMVFTLVNALLIRGLPFADSDRIMYVGERDRVSGRTFMVSWPDFQDWRASQTSFAGLAMWSAGTFNVSGAGQPAERYNGAYFSADAFAVLGERPILGRDFRPDDDRAGAAAVVILGADIWRNRYAADPNIVGAMVRVNDVPATVVGVMAETTKFPDADLWLPLAAMPGLAERRRTDRFGIQALGRLADGVSRERAQTELTSIAARLERDFAGTNQNIDAVVLTFSERLHSGPIRLVVLTAMGAVGFVLLIACANVASLLLVRSAQRAREIAIRVSIGATRARIVRQLLIESVLLALLGAIPGLLVAQVGTHWFDVATQGLGRPYYLQFAMDGHVLAFFASVCLATALIFGLAPALHSSKIEIAEIMKEGGRAGPGGLRARRWTGALVIGELALALVLLAGAGFMIRSFLALYRLDAGGVETGRILTASLALPDHKYPTPARRADFYRVLDQRLRALGPVRGATLASHLPLGSGSAVLLSIDGRGTDAVSMPTVTRVTVGPGYFTTLGLTLERGRAFTDDDGSSGREVAVVNERFAAMYFAGVDPLGHRIKLLAEPAASQQPWIAIVGVSPTVRQRHLREFDPDPVVYVPYRLAPIAPMTLLVQAAGEPSRLTGTIREAVRELDPDLPLFAVATLDQALAQSRSFYRIFGVMFAAFGGVALILAALGLYAVTAYTVTQRTHEIGVRVALGAGARQVWWLIARRSFVQLAIGLSLGMAGGLGVGQLLRGVLAQTSAVDPLMLLGIAALFVVVSLTACFLPARRATAVDPVIALR